VVVLARHHSGAKRVAPAVAACLYFTGFTMLTIELVPQTSWFTNLRSELSSKKWDEVRKGCYAKAGYRCEICNGVGKKHPVECHETWYYDDEKKVQTLTGLIALCPECHQVKHIGLAQIKGKYEIAKKHLAKVNKWDIEDAEEYIRAQFEIWHKRSQTSWSVDMSLIQ